MLMITLPLCGDTTADASIGLGVDFVADFDSTVPAATTPWILVDLSVAGYPSSTFGWFADAAVEGALSPAERQISAVGLLIVGGSMRSGLSTIRLDVQSLLDLSTDEAPLRLEFSPILSFSTGSASWSLLVEGRGSFAAEQGVGETYRSVGALIGGSTTLFAQLAPTLELSWVGSIPIGSEPVQRIGVNLEIPWYPPHPAAFDASLTTMRSIGGSSIESAGGVVYFPEHYRVWSGRFAGAYAWSRTLLFELDLAVAIKRSDHGVMIDGEPSGDPQNVASLNPAGRLRVDLTDRLSAGIELGGAFVFSNAPSMRSTTFYATLDTRYRR